MSANLELSLANGTQQQEMRGWKEKVESISFSLSPCLRRLFLALVTFLDDYGQLSFMSPPLLAFLGLTVVIASCDCCPLQPQYPLLVTWNLVTSL